jgi:hypothetical protein
MNFSLRRLFRRGSREPGKFVRSLMEQIETLIETGAQLGGSEPNRSPADGQEVGRQLRIPQYRAEAGSNAVMPIRITATINPPFSSPKTAPRKRSKPLSPDCFITQRATLAAMPNRSTMAKK